MTNDQHWAVTVSRSGEEIVTIESNLLSGREITVEDEATIRMAAHHLLAFIGECPPPGSATMAERPEIAPLIERNRNDRGIRRSSVVAVDGRRCGDDLVWR